MNEPVSVASVLLLALNARQRTLLPWLRVVGEPVSYSLDALEPHELPSSGRSWDVILIDGESVRGDAYRQQLLHRASQHPHRFAATIYVYDRLATDIESDQALGWADDIVQQGWEFGDRVRRRVQLVALAAWRRNAAIRLEALRLGERHLRVVGSKEVEEPSPSAACSEPVARPRAATRKIRRIDAALPFVLLERANRLGADAHRLVAVAFHEGRRVGVSAVRQSAEHACDQLLEELEVGREALRPEDVDDIEATFAGVGSPIVSARFAGASAALDALRGELKQLTHAELDAIERHDARPASEP